MKGLSVPPAGELYLRDVTWMAWMMFLSRTGRRPVPCDVCWSVVPGAFHFVNVDPTGSVDPTGRVADLA